MVKFRISPGPTGEEKVLQRRNSGTPIRGDSVIRPAPSNMTTIFSPATAISSEPLVENIVDAKRKVATRSLGITGKSCCALPCPRSDVYEAGRAKERQKGSPGSPILRPMSPVAPQALPVACRGSSFGSLQGGALSVRRSQIVEEILLA